MTGLTAPTPTIPTVDGALELPPKAAAFEVALFRDGRCSPGDIDPNAMEDDECKVSAPLLRSPSVALIDREHRSVAVGAVPPGCRPERFFTAGGIGVLLCADKAAGSATRTAVHVIDRSGSWTAEGDLPIAADTANGIVMAGDGTLLLRAGWSDAPERRAFVRAPRGLGDPRAWREVEIKGAVEVRVDVGGALLILGTSAATPAPSWISVALDQPGGERVSLAGRATVQGSMVDFGIEGRRVVFSTHDRFLSGNCRQRVAPAREGQFTRWVLSRGGELRRAEAVTMLRDSQK